MSSSSTLTALATAAMKPHAAGGGFKKERLNYRRRLGETQQVINFQLSQGNTVGEARCYVNLAISFDAIFSLEGRQAPAAIKEHEGHFRARLEELVDGAPPWWTVTAATDTAVLGVELGAALARAVLLLDKVDRPAAMLSLMPLDRGAQNYLKAQLHYVNGDLDAAFAALCAGAAFFADRGVTPEKMIRQLHLEELIGRR